jgi:tRNA1(Val) A37 N6-methylase TrmN6
MVAMTILDSTGPMAVETTEDGLLGGRIRLLQPRRGYRVAVDAVLLAAAVEARMGERVLDLGCGAGAVALCLAARVPGVDLVGVELQEALAELAQRNVELNGMQNRVRIVRHDIAAPLPADLRDFDHVVTNPPYLAAAVADLPPDKGKALATVESSADLACWLTVAIGALKAGGTLTLIHRHDRRTEILRHLAAAEVTVKSLPDAGRVLVRAVTGKPPTRRDSPPLTLHSPGGGYSDDVEAVLRHAAPLAF